MQTSSINPMLTFIRKDFTTRTISSSRYTISDWGPGEPSNGPGEDCAAFYAGFDFRWKNIDCSLPSYYICMHYEWK